MINTEAANVQVIKESKRGSEIYGLLEKTAFLLHTKNPSASETDNWFKAQYEIAQWWQSAADEDWPMLNVLPEQMRYFADDISKSVQKLSQYYPGIKDDWVKNWDITLDLYAQAIVENIRVIPRLLLWPQLFNRKQ